MSAYLALYEDRLIVSQPVRLPAAPRALFVREGVVEVESGDGHVLMQASECRLFESTIELRGTATVWSFEIGAGGVVQSPAARELSLVLAHDLALDESLQTGESEAVAKQAGSSTVWAVASVASST